MALSTFSLGGGEPEAPVGAPRPSSPHNSVSHSHPWLAGPKCCAGCPHTPLPLRSGFPVTIAISMLTNAFAAVAAPHPRYC